MTDQFVDTTHQTSQPDAVYALSQSNDQLFAARLSGLYRSNDSGRSWHNTFASLDQFLAATAVAVSGSTLFAGVNGAVLRSEDHGEHWFIAGLSSPAPHVVALALSPTFADDGFVAAGTADDGVFISNDRGEHWTAWNFGLIDLHIFALAISPDFSTDRTLVAGTESGVFLSRNAGRSWQELSFSIEAAPVLSVALSPNFTLDGRLYAGTEHHGLYVSEDRGQHWHSVADTRFETAINVIQISATNPGSVFLLTEDRVLKASDDGSSWQQLETFAADQVAMALLVDAATDAVWVGFSDGTVLPLPRGDVER